MDVYLNKNSIKYCVNLVLDSSHLLLLTLATVYKDFMIAVDIVVCGIFMCFKA